VKPYVGSLYSKMLPVNVVEMTDESRHANKCRKMPGQCVFNVHWLQDEQYARWLTSVNDKNKARCKICLKDIDIGNMGESAMKRHAAGAKHNDLIKAIA